MMQEEGDVQETPQEPAPGLTMDEQDLSPMQQAQLEQARLIIRGLDAAVAGGLPLEEVAAELRTTIPEEAWRQLAEADAESLVGQALLLVPEAEHLASEPGIAYLSQLQALLRA